MNTITIQQLQSDEWKIFKNVRLEALKQNPGVFKEKYEEASTYHDSYWEEKLSAPHRIFLVARDREKYIGLAGAAPSNREENMAIIMRVSVDKEHRGKGIGKMLMKELLSKITVMPEVKTLKLWVEKDNIPAYNLYKGLGFEIIGEETYNDMETFVMIKSNQ
ncbi:MAG: GNAT family N-acetyltransferase [Patescibacteria group bacterium]